MIFIKPTYNITYIYKYARLSTCISGLAQVLTSDLYIHNLLIFINTFYLIRLTFINFIIRALFFLLCDDDVFEVCFILLFCFSFLCSFSKLVTSKLKRNLVDFSHFSCQNPWRRILFFTKDKGCIQGLGSYV